MPPSLPVLLFLLPLLSPLLPKISPTNAVLLKGVQCPDLGDPAGECGNVTISQGWEMKKFNHCRTISGPLVLRNIIGLEHSFACLTEVTSYILVARVGPLKRLSDLFPVLTVIRGNKLFYNYALMLYFNCNLVDSTIPTLVNITRGGVCLMHDTHRGDTCPLYWGKDEAARTAGVIRSTGRSINLSTGNESRQLTGCHYPPDDNSTSSCCPSTCYGGCFSSQSCYACAEVLHRSQCQLQCPIGTEETSNKCVAVTHPSDSGESAYKYCPSSASVSSLSDAEAIAGCQQLDTLTISGPDLSSELTQLLSSLRRVTHLLIVEYTAMSNLDFLSGLESVGTLGIDKPSLVIRNTRLRSLPTSWSNLKVHGQVKFSNNPELCRSHTDRVAAVTSDWLELTVAPSSSHGSLLLTVHNSPGDHCYPLCYYTVYYIEASEDMKCLTTDCDYNNRWRSKVIEAAVDSSNSSLLTLTMLRVSTRYAVQVMLTVDETAWRRSSIEYSTTALYYPPLPPLVECEALSPTQLQVWWRRVPSHPSGHLQYEVSVSPLAIQTTHCDDNSRTGTLSVGNKPLASPLKVSAESVSQFMHSERYKSKNDFCISKSLSKDDTISISTTSDHHNFTELPPGYYLVTLHTALPITECSHRGKPCEDGDSMASNCCKLCSLVPLQTVCRTAFTDTEAPESPHSPPRGHKGARDFLHKREEVKESNDRHFNICPLTISGNAVPPECCLSLSPSLRSFSLGHTSSHLPKTVIFASLLGLGLSIALFLFVWKSYSNNKYKFYKAITIDMKEAQELACRHSVNGLLVNRDAVKLGDTLGTGNFSNVLSAKFSRHYHELVLSEPSTYELMTDSRDVDVVVKIPKVLRSGRDTSKFLQEVALIRECHSPHVISVFGIVIQPTIAFYIMEAMRGDLKRFLATNTLDEKKKFHLSKQICEGMSHLQSLRIVHGDLSCRNILIGHDEVIKIADFGQALQLPADSNYQIQVSNRPVNWLPPETLLDNSYSLKTDVWSFGIVLWEMNHGGDRPYGDMDAASVRKLVSEGHSLPPSENTPPLLSSIQTQCLKTRPQDRPTFEQINNDSALSYTCNNISNSAHMTTPANCIFGCGLPAPLQQDTYDSNDRDKFNANGCGLPAPTQEYSYDSDDSSLYNLANLIAESAHVTNSPTSSEGTSNSRGYCQWSCIVNKRCLCLSGANKEEDSTIKSNQNHLQSPTSSHINTVTNLEYMTEPNALADSSGVSLVPNNLLNRLTSASDISGKEPVFSNNETFANCLSSNEVTSNEGKKLVDCSEKLAASLLNCNGGSVNQHSKLLNGKLTNSHATKFMNINCGLSEQSDMDHLKGSSTNQHTTNNLNGSSTSKHTTNLLNGSSTSKYTTNNLNSRSTNQYEMDHLNGSSTNQHTANNLNVSSSNQHVTNISNGSSTNQHTANIFSRNGSSTNNRNARFNHSAAAQNPTKQPSNVRFAPTTVAYVNVGNGITVYEELPNK